MAEAMGLERPVIATAYSGNLDFMTPDNSYLVDYVRDRVPEECDPYPKGSVWADPNLDQAADYMRRVYRWRGEAARKARRARQDILTKHNIEVTAAVLRQRLGEIRRTRDHVVLTEGLRATQTVSTNPELSEVTRLGNPDHIVTFMNPIPSVPPGSRFGWPRLMAQRLLFRILRPYWWQQRQIQALLVDRFHELARAAARAANAEFHQRHALESLWAAVHSLEDSRGSHQPTVTSADATTLSRRLGATPYLDQPNRFHYSDERGRRLLGFQTRRGGEGEMSLGLEDIFRGNEAAIRDRSRVYLPLLQTHERVIEIGCGRGELLDLLDEAGVPAIGVDIDEAMVRRCRARGHMVEQVDGLSYLRAQADSSVPAIFAAQVVEHLPHEQLVSFLQLSRAKLKSGGQLIFETMNPHALEAFKTFWTALTHQRPIFPEVAVALCWLSGFDQAYVLFPNGSGNLNRDRSTQAEYAVVATKLEAGAN
jgi:2-polyprenyl-3-methyl-5-hydroxy-6-metoxy-1,4-benzoquinol methylase